MPPRGLSRAGFGFGAPARACPAVTFCALFAVVSTPIAAVADVRAADDVILQTEDGRLAHAIESVWEIIDRSSVEVVDASGEHWVRRAWGRGQRERDARCTVVPVRDVHEAANRLFTRPYQSVSELSPRIGDDGRAEVTVDVDAGEAYVLVTGERASEMPELIDSTARPRWGRADRDPPDVAVRHLGRRWRGEPLTISVSPSWRVSLLTHRQPMRLRYPGWESRTIEVENVPGVIEPARHRLVVTLDDQPLRWQRHGDASVVADLPEQLARGPHVIGAQLYRLGSDELVEEAASTLHGPAHYTLELSAGGDHECVGLDGDAVALPERVRDASSGSLRLVAGGRREGRFLVEGARICGWAGLRAPGLRRTDVLASTGRHEPAVLTIEVEPLEPALRWGVPLGFAFAVFGLLLFFWWPRRTAPVTHVGWLRGRPGGYRDWQPASWHVVRLPADTTPLATLAPELDDLGGTLTAGPRNVSFGIEKPVVVAPPGLPVSLQVTDFRAAAGTQILCEDVRLVLLDERAAARLDEGEQPKPVDAAEVERAREAGYTGAATAVARGRPIVRAAAALIVALALTAAAHLPSVLASPPEPRLGPWAETTWAWMSTFGVGGLVAVILGWVFRSSLAN